MIEFENFILATPMFTGADVFLDAANAVRLQWKGVMYNTPPALGQTKMVVSLVRNPYNWLKSLYFAPKDVRERIWRETPFPDEFPHFIDEVLKTSDIVWNYFEKYKTSTVLRTEDMPYNLVEFFESQVRDETVLRKVKGEYKPPIPGFGYDSDLKTAVFANEQQFCRAYRYL